MSASEKTHMVVILIAVLGGAALLGCVAFGALFFITAAPSATPPVMMAPAPVQAVSSSVGASSLLVTKTRKLAPGHYEVTVRDTGSKSGDFNTYQFSIQSVSTPKTTVTVKSQPSGDPLPVLLDTVLVVKTSPDQGEVQFQYQIIRAGPGSHSESSSGYLLTLQSKQDGEASPKKESPKKQGSAPK